MNPYDIRNLTLRQLRETRSKMMEMEYLMAIDTLPAQDRTRAFMQLSDVQLHYLRLRTTKLDTIREKITEHEGELNTSIQSLNSALGELNQVRTIMAATSHVLSVVGRIVTLVA